MALASQGHPAEDDAADRGREPQPEGRERRDEPDEPAS
jgi:hypothetical protein